MRKLLWMVILFWITISLSAKKIGIALSGGGARGFAQIGMLKVLEEEGIYPDYIAGTSIGAIVGAMYAMGYTASEMEALALMIDWQELFSDAYTRRDLNLAQKRWAEYGNVHFEIDEEGSFRIPQGMISANNINLELFRLFAATSHIESFNRLPIPFRCVATNLISGNMRVFDQGSLMQAVRASMSIPSILKPFELADSIYIDGGISNNLPVEQLIDMGAEISIAMKTSSGLRPANKLNNFFQVYDQTLNIGITRNVSRSITEADLVLDPLLDGFSSSNFRQISQIILAGETYARENIAKIRALVEKHNLKTSNTLPPILKTEPLHKVYITSISVEGSKYISSVKIKEYLDIHSGNSYALGTMVDRFQRAWNLQLFHYLYPTLTPNENGWHLTIHVGEKTRNSIALSNAYSTDEGLAVGTILSLNNYLSRDSRLVAEARVGGSNELNIDFVRNFGERFGVYYRIFPYINEKTLYVYENHERIHSIGSLESGATGGVGFLLFDQAILETYGFHYYTKLYRKIADIDALEDDFAVTGTGIKAYHESTNDFYFPMNGSKVLSKLTFSRNIAKNDLVYGKYVFDSETFFPVGDGVAIKLRFSYGANFDKNDELGFDPFYLGGSEGFYGYRKYEVSAPFYKRYDIGLRFNPNRNLFVDTGLQGLNHANSDIWSPHQDIFFTTYAGIGYRTIFGPLQLMGALNEDRSFKVLANIGFTKDIFAFSRR